MKKLLVSTAVIASLVVTAPAARANEWGGLAAGLAGGLIAGAIASSMQQPRTVYVPVERRHYAPRPRPAPSRVVYVHDRPVINTVVAPVPVAVPAPVAAPAPANNNNIVVAPAPAPAPIIINNSPAPAPQPIVINTASAAPSAAPTSAAAAQCQKSFEKTSEYLACLQGSTAVAAK